MDRETFITEVVKDYVSFLKKKKLTVPTEFESAFFEELGAQVNTMLTKKIYGCLNIDEFRSQDPNAPDQVTEKYEKLKAS